jgi:hypothetical protein
MKNRSSIIGIEQIRFFETTALRPFVYFEGKKKHQKTPNVPMCPVPCMAKQLAAIRAVLATHDSPV